LGVVGACENVVGIKQGEKENRDRFNGRPRLCPPLDKERKKKEKILRKPLTLPSPAGWKGEKDEKILTALLTFILSRKGRENLKEFI